MNVFLKRAIKQKLDKIDEDIEKGKTNLLNDKQALSKYSKYLKGKNVRD